MASGTIKTPGWKLIWTNPNPSSDFAAQTISIDLSQYKMCVICFAHSTTDAARYSELSLIESGWFFSFFEPQGFPSGTLGGIRRRGYCEPSGITFEEGMSKSGSGNATINNAVMVPLYIYAQ